MSTSCHPQTARLGQPPAPDLRRQFVAEIRRRFRPIRGRVRHFASTADGFGLRTDARTATLADGDEPDDWPDPPESVYQFTTDANKADAFVRWLREQLRARVLEPVAAGQAVRIRSARGRDTAAAVRAWDHWTARYLRGTYQQAWEESGARLRVSGVPVAGTRIPDDTGIESGFDIGVRPATLRRAYSRTYENLASISTDAAAERVRETITGGIAEGVNPREMARRLTKDIRTLQHTRAEVLARTETIATYSDATLDRYEAAGVDGVAHGEWSDAGDSRVCPICRSLDGREYSIDEMRTGTFTFEPSDDDPDHLAGEYPLKPPAHPSGRCTILPVLS